MRRTQSVAVLAVLCVSGCGTATDESEGLRYSPPGWMADVVAQDEEYMSAMTACLEDRGQSVLTHAGKVAIQPPTSESGETLPGEAELADEAWEECTALVPEQSYLSDDRDLEYDRMLDVIACLEAEGHSLPEPPSREAWVSGSVQYSPYAELIETEDGGSWAVETDEVLRLLEVCPASSQKLILLDPREPG
jgi:hypothetical protein